MKVYKLSCGKWLDKKRFISYLERKVLYTIRKFSLINKKDRVAVACSGGKDSTVALHVLNKFCKERKQNLEALALDEGIKDYRDRLLKQLENFCKKQDIKLNTFSFKEEFGFTLKDKIKKIKQLGFSNCYVCSILKRWLLNKKASELGFDVVATGHSLDDEAETILLNQFKGNPQLLAKLGPLSGVSRGAFVQRIKPLCLCKEKEIVLYAKLLNLPLSLRPCPLRGKTFRVEIRNWLSHLEKEHSEVKNAIVRSFLKIMPLLKEKYKKIEFSKCKRCGFPSSQDVCKSCWILEKLRNKK